MADETKAAKKRAPKWVKITAIVLAAILLVLVALVGAAAIVWRNEIATVANFRKIADRNDAHQDGAVYRMDVSGDFYFDDFLAQGGASSDSELIDFITNSITRGLIDMTIQESEIACSAFTAVTLRGTGSSRATTIFPRRTRRSCSRIRATAVTNRFRRSICSSWAWTQTGTSRG